jgi:hypothetical protein
VLSAWVLPARVLSTSVLSTWVLSTCFLSPMLLPGAVLSGAILLKTLFNGACLHRPLPCGTAGRAGLAHFEDRRFNGPCSLR